MKTSKLKKVLLSFVMAGAIVTGSIPAIESNIIDAKAEEIVNKGTIEVNTEVLTSIPGGETDVWSFVVDDPGVLMVTTSVENWYSQVGYDEGDGEGYIEIVDSNGSVLAKDDEYWYKIV